MGGGNRSARALALCWLIAGCAPPGPTAYPVPIATAPDCGLEREAVADAGEAIDRPVGVAGTLAAVLTGDQPVARVGHLTDGAFTLVPAARDMSAETATATTVADALLRCRASEVAALAGALREGLLSADQGLARLRGLRNARDRDRAALETLIQALEAEGGDVAILRTRVAAADIRVSAGIDAVEQAMM